MKESVRAFALIFFIPAVFFSYAHAASCFIPGATYDPAVPTLEQVAGHGWAERITTHAECEDYVQALAEASPRAKLFTYGKTWEGRTLYYLVIATEERLAELERIKTELRALAHPLSLDAEKKSELLGRLPVVTWLANTIHGNESSGMDAGLWAAYHLLAARGDTLVEMIFDKSIVVIDPLQNPDGHDRFANYFRSTTGKWPAADPNSAERREPWPGGRTNHYLFDMNRDWYAMTQVESRGRVAAYLEWYPHIYIDLHEMGSDATYYFPPTAPPTNPRMSASQVKWFAEFGKNNAAWFDRFGFKYYTRESFDAYFPGYGCTWPSLSGSIGMTYEQASSRGLLALRSDETVMPYAETVRHHAVASLSTAEFAARNRESVLADYVATRTPAVDIPADRAYLIACEPDPSRTEKLVGILLKQGIRVQRAENGLECRSLSAGDKRKVARKNFPAGTYIVPARQESHALAANLLEPEIFMDEDYVREQERRLAAGLRPQIYDITAWSLPSFFGVNFYITNNLPAGNYQILESLAKPAVPRVKKAGLAYILPGDFNSTMAALADLLRDSVRVYTNDLAFTNNEKKYPRGSLIVPVKENPENLPETIARIEKKRGVEFYPTDSGWTSEGVNFGSPNVHYLPAPKVLLAWDEPTHSYSAGWCRYVLEQQYGVKVTAVKTGDLGRIRLDRYNVLVLPNGWNFGEIMGKDGLAKLKDWIARGGTLVGIQGATTWMASPEAGLLEAVREYRLDGDTAKGKKTPSGKEKTNRVPGSEIKGLEEFRKVITAEDAEPRSLPGVLARIHLDPDHWLSCGYDSTAVVFVQGYQVFSPLKRSQGRNVAFYAGAEDLLVSGHIWKGPVLKQLAFKPYLMYRAIGRGHVIGFTEDPNFRGVCDGTARLIMNAVLTGPGH